LNHKDDNDEIRQNINNIKQGERLWSVGYAANAVIPLKQTHRRKNVLPARTSAHLWIIPAIRRIVQESPLILRSRDPRNKSINENTGRV
jgi:hypothetical protein